MEIIKDKRFRKQKYIVVCVLIFLLVFGLLHRMNAMIEPQLQAAAKQYTGSAINRIVKKVLTKLDYQSDSLYQFYRNDEGEVSDIQYDSYALNQLLYSALDTIEASLHAAQDGEEDPLIKEVFYDDGIVYKIPIGYLTGLYMFHDAGVQIPVRMRILNEVTGQIKTETKPYGVNNTVMIINLQIQVHAQAVTFLGVDSFEMSTEIPLAIQLIQGNIPAYINYLPSNNTE
ncbi:sporulation protein YunB [Erysipelotrichaceae bacterium HCN-30851]